jgi:ribonuclease HII
MMDSSSTRHDTKHQIITVQTILRSKQLSSSQRDELNRNVQELKKQLETSEQKADTEEMAYRVRFLKENRGMYDIFHTIWLLFTVYTQDGYLLKDGYVRLQHSLQIILAGLPSYSPIDHSSIEVTTSSSIARSTRMPSSTCCSRSSVSEWALHPNNCHMHCLN